MEEKTTIEKIADKLSKNIPNYFLEAPKNYQKIEEDSFVIPVSRQLTIESLIPLLKWALGIQVLFGVGNVLDNNQKCVLYSVPNMNEMYAIYMYSKRYGIIDSISILVFDSMDKEYIKLMTDLNKIKQHRGYVYESQPAIELTQNFI